MGLGSRNTFPWAVGTSALLDLIPCSCELVASRRCCPSVAKAVFAKLFAAKGRVFWCCRVSPGHCSTPDFVLCLFLCSPPTRGRGSRDVGEQAVAEPAREEPSGGSAALCCHPTSESHPACTGSSRPRCSWGCSNILDTRRTFARARGPALTPAPPAASLTWTPHFHPPSTAMLLTPHRFTPH